MKKALYICAALAIGISPVEAGIANFKGQSIHDDNIDAKVAEIRASIAAGDDVVDLSDNYIGDEGFGRIIRVIEEDAELRSKVKVLNISNNRITAESMYWIVRFLNNAVSEYIDIRVTSAASIDSMEKFTEAGKRLNLDVNQIMRLHKKLVWLDPGTAEGNHWLREVDAKSARAYLTKYRM